MTKKEKYIEKLEEDSEKLMKELGASQKEADRYKLSCARLREIVKHLKDNYTEDMNEVIRDNLNGIKYWEDSKEKDVEQFLKDIMQGARNRALEIREV